MGAKAIANCKITDGMAAPYVNTYEVLVVHVGIPTCRSTAAFRSYMYLARYMYISS